MIETFIANEFNIAVELAHGIIFSVEVIGAIIAVGIGIKKLSKKLSLDKDSIITEIDTKYKENSDSINKLQNCTDNLHFKVDNLKEDVKETKEDLKDIREKTQGNSENIASFSSQLRSHLKNGKD